MDKRLKAYFIDQRIDFGKKYRGRTIREVYRFAPSYIQWAIIEIEFFYINLDVLEEILVTPMRMEEMKIEGETFWVTCMKPAKDYVTEAYKYLASGRTILEEKFSFSKEAKNIAKSKWDLIAKED